MHTTWEKETYLKKLHYYDFKHTTFWKRENHVAVKGQVGWKDEQAEDLGGGEAFCLIL